MRGGPGLSDVPVQDEGSGQAWRLSRAAGCRSYWALTRRSSTQIRNRLPQQGLRDGPFFHRGLMLLTSAHVPPTDHGGGVRLVQARRLPRADGQIFRGWLTTGSSTTHASFVYLAVKALTLDIASMHSWATNPAPITGHQAEQGATITTCAGNAVIRNQRATVHLVARIASTRALENHFTA